MSCTSGNFMSRNTIRETMVNVKGTAFVVNVCKLVPVSYCIGWEPTGLSEIELTPYNRPLICDPWVYPSGHPN